MQTISTEDAPPAAGVGGCAVVTPGSAHAAPPSTSRSTYRRRRLAVLGMLVLLVSAAAIVIGGVRAEAGLEDPVAGHAVVAPGETLWDVAAASAPDGIDPRRQLQAIRSLNGIADSHVDAWEVVLLPAW